MRTKVEEITIPAIALRGVVVFPKMNIQFEVSRKKSIAALKEVLKTDKKIAREALRERAIEEYGTSAVWLGGIPLMNSMFQI